MTRRVVAWGAYDDGKPRVRLLLDALRRADALEAEIHVPAWSGVEDKSVAGKAALLRSALRWLAGMPRALWRLARLPGDAAVLLPYPGTPDLFLAAPLARLRGRKLVLDAFLPIHDTVVRDRALVRDGGLAAKALRLIERAGLRLADVVLTDTDAQAAFLAREYGLPEDRFITVLVGAEPQFDEAERGEVNDLLGPFAAKRKVLFYGQFIPLHGLATILEAARLTQDEDFGWIVVGSGQQDDVMQRFLAEGGSDNVHWLRWVDYARLPALIAACDLGLGIFGGSDKAARVIPNKLFQQLAMGKRVVTRASPAVDRLAREFGQTIVTVPPEDPQALAAAVREAMVSEKGDSGRPTTLRGKLSPDAGVARLIARLGDG